ncbi:MAG: hypothetical protein AB201_00890 [Parcubacteria bacterium C7867-006]|nr:MAG: hypothetical protein AB201_00890 [Parcubacteria bacterium C7867-006]
MKIIKPVSLVDVKRAFVISDLGKIKGNQKGVSEKTFENNFNRAKTKVLKFSEADLDKHIEWSKRLNAYNNCKWYIAEFSPPELGVWRRSSGLPLSWTNQSLLETSKKINKVLSSDSKFLKKRSRYAIYNILNSKSQISQKEKYLYPIVFKNSEGTRGRSYLRFKTKGDIDDGCMRSIAMTISGKKSILVYFGVPKEITK